MEAQPATSKSLGNMSAEERSRVYRELRAGLGISSTEPMIPLPQDELLAWSKRFAEVLASMLAEHAVTRTTASKDFLQSSIFAYGEVPTDAFLDSQIVIGAELPAAGLTAIALHTLVNRLGLAAGRRAAREVLSAESAQIVEERHPSVMLLRHGLMQEGMLGTSGLPAAPAS